MKIVLTVLTELLLLPYVGWGIYNLQRRYRYYDDISPAAEASTLVCVTVYLYVQFAVLELWMEQAPVYLIFAVLGLFVSAAALYGHMAVSLLSWVLVDFMLPSPAENVDHPRMGPQEALERQKDYASALEGYMVLARIYPRDVEVPSRIANCLLRLDRAGEAPGWLERALGNCSSAEEALPVTNRLCEVYERVLNRPEQAREALAAYLARYPDSSDAGEVRDHIAHIGAGHSRTHDTALVPLAEGGLGETPLSDFHENERAAGLPELAPIEGPLSVQDETRAREDRKRSRAVKLEIEALGPPEQRAEENDKQFGE